MLVSKLHHQNIIKMVEMFVDEAAHTAYIVMEYFEGKALSDILNKDPLGRLSGKSVESFVIITISREECCSDL
jgi:serine/threonine protein kinase